MYCIVSFKFDGLTCDQHICREQRHENERKQFVKQYQKELRLNSRISNMIQAVSEDWNVNEIDLQQQREMLQQYAKQKQQQQQKQKQKQKPKYVLFGDC